MVTEEDLIRTVTAAYGAGWRQVKLYFMCGLPTETDEDVLQIAELARDVIKAGREAAGTRDIRCTVSIGGFVPKPHTPFQWAAQLDHETTDARLQLLRDAIRADREYGQAIGFRYHDGKPGIVEGLLSRGDRRVGRVILEAWRDGGRFDGWSEHFSYDRWVAAGERGLAGAPVDLDWYTIREREQNEVLPWDHLDSGLDRDWLWQDWQDSLAGGEVEDCRWTPCFDCGVCDQLGHPDPGRAERGRAAAPADRALPGRGGLMAARRPPERDIAPAVQRLRIRYAKRGPLRFSSHRDFQRALERALRRAAVPMAFSAGFSPHPKISYANAAPTGAASEAEYVEIAVTRRCDPHALREELDSALPPGLDIVDVVEARIPDLVARLQASRWSIEVPAVGTAALQAAWETLLAAETVPVQRLMKSGLRTLDLRPALVSGEVERLRDLRLVGAGPDRRERDSDRAA